MSSSAAVTCGSTSAGRLVYHAKYVRVADQDVKLPERVRAPGAVYTQAKFSERGVQLDARQVGGTPEPGEVVPITQTRTFYSTISRATPPMTLPPLPTVTFATNNPPALPSGSISTAVSSTAAGPSPSNSQTIQPKSPPGFPTALVASLATLIPLSFLVVFGFYLYYRRRDRNASSVSTNSSILSLPRFNRGGGGGGGDSYVWGPLGLIRRRERDKDGNPVLKAQETPAKIHIDPIAEAIRKEERERVARQRRSGEARFYAPGVRHLVEYVGSRERMKVIIDWNWKERLKVDRPW